MKNALGRSALFVFIFLLYIDLATNDSWSSEWQCIWFLSIIVCAVIFISSEN